MKVWNLGILAQHILNMFVLNVDKNMNETIDIKVNKIMKQLSNHWHTTEKHNYLDVFHKEAYRMYIRYYTGGNPYNVFEEKYQKRISNRGIY